MAVIMRVTSILPWFVLLNIGSSPVRRHIRLSVSGWLFSMCLSPVAVDIPQREVVMALAAEMMEDCQCNTHQCTRL